MSLGPSSLQLIHRKIINKKQNKKLIKKYLRGEIDWNHKSLKPIKDKIRYILRNEQENRCIYCRRIIRIERRNVTEDIEHFLDKSKAYYKRWAFSPINLALSCRSCNFVKSTKDLGDMMMRTALNIQTGAGRFKWLHPYLDDYHANIEIRKGWLYSVKNGATNARAAQTLITDCELDKVEKVEQISEHIKLRQSRITNLLAKAIAKKQNNRAEKLVEWLKREQDAQWFDY